MRRARGTGPSRLAAAGLLLLGGLVAGGARAEDPRIDYMLHCQGCHLPDGAGTPGSVPPLRGSVGRFLRVPGGRAFLIRVPGSAQSPLDDASLAAVLNWMVRAFGPAEVAADFQPFTAAEVSRHRTPPLSDVAAVRRELVRQMDGPGR